jgi:hypothetical protein
MPDQTYKEVDSVIAHRGYDVHMHIRFFDTPMGVDISKIEIAKIVRRSDNSEVYPTLFTTEWKRNAAKKLAHQYS